MKNFNAYKILGWLAMLLTPIGAVIFFGWRVYTAVFSDTQINQLAIVAGIATAIGLETVGIYAGHLAMDLWQRKDGRAWLAAVIMIVYVAIGMIELAGTIGQVMFMIAPLVYVLVGLRHAVDEKVGEETAVNTAKLDFQIEQARLDKEAERKRKADNDARQHEENMRKLDADAQAQAQKEADETALKLAKLEAKKRPVTYRSDGGQMAVSLPSDYRLLDSTHKEKIKNLTSGELAELAGISDSTARRWKRQVSANGHANGVVK